MTLNNPGMIRQANKMFYCEMEPLYWKVEDALRLGNIEKARNLFMILLYAAKHRPELVSSGLKPGHRKRLKELSYELFEDFVPKNGKSIEIRQSIGPVKLPFAKEVELQEYLQTHPEILSRALGEDVRVTGIEVDVGHDYKCDVVAEGEKFYPIELKIGQTNHAVVSQCLKYCYYFYHKLRYNLYKEIQGVTIGNGFDSWSINELRREGLWCFAIKPAKDHNIELARVD